MSSDWDSLVNGVDREEVLPEHLAQAFMDRAVRIHARKGQLLIAQGSEADDVYLIMRGKLQISLFSANGRETILRDMGPGRLVGEMSAISDMPRSASATVVEDGGLFGLMSGSGFRSFLHDVPGMGYWMAVQLASRVRNLTEKASDLATLPVSARLQNELLRIAMTQGDGGDRAIISALPTHADLAARIGTHREAVTRELRLLAQEGIVAQSGRTLTITSIPRLRATLKRLTQ